MSIFFPPTNFDHFFWFFFDFFFYFIQGKLKWCETKRGEFLNSVLTLACCEWRAAAQGLNPLRLPRAQMPVPYLRPNVGVYTRTPSHQPLVFSRRVTDHLPQVGWSRRAKTTCRRTWVMAKTCLAINRRWLMGILSRWVLCPVQETPMWHWSVTIAVLPLYLQGRCPPWTAAEDSVPRDWTGKKKKRKVAVVRICSPS